MAGLVITNAQIITMDPFCPRAEALAIKEGRIFSIGSSKQIFESVGSKNERWDLRGRTVLPGFIDAHLHFRALAESLVILNIGADRGVSDIPHLQKRIYLETLRYPPGTWIRAGGYDDTALAEKRDPTRWDLDPVSMHHPLKLTHRSGQAHVLNSLALTQLNITRESPDPEGGWLERDLETGEPTGVFYGAGDFLAERISPLDEGLLNAGLQSADKELLRQGITTFQDASPRNDLDRWQDFKQWKSRGWISGGGIMMLGRKGFQEFLEDPCAFTAPGLDLRTDGVKIKVNDFSGRLFPGQQELEELVFSIHRAGLQAVIHALEEPAIEAACLAIEKALKKLPRNDHRHRIEHCSVCPPSLAERLASLDIMVVSHPAFVYFNGDRYLKTVPFPQLQHLYPFKTFGGKGVSLAAGSDAPIAPVNPLAALFGAVTRKTRSGERVLEEEKIGIFEALALVTTLAARSAFEEKERGSISPGKKADLVVLSENPFTVPEAEIKDLRVERTLIDGKVVFQA
jgi:hypothetical protein